jgi:hypothetical protein
VISVAKRAIVGELQDELKRKDERIEELRQEIDEQRELIERLRNHAEDYSQCIESWCEAFEMEMTDDGGWTWQPWRENHNKIVDDYNDLVRRWNKYLPLINRQPRNVGRPVAASEAQIREVLQRRRAGESLRNIAEEMTLGLQTVRTVIGQKAGSDRTTRHHRQRFERIDIDQQQRRKWKRQRDTGNRLPKRVNAFLKEGQALVKEAKGLGR